MASPPIASQHQGAAAVQIQDLWFRHGSASDGRWTLRGIALELAPGELLGLLGPSGCGKTTLLRLIAGFERPERGSITLEGRPVAGGGRWLEPERRGVGMVFQDYALFPHLDAWANACFGLRRGADTSRVRWLLELFGLDGLERRYPHELSGGQRQRLALARALAPAPALLLLDEPFSNLDAEVRLRLRGELPVILERCGAAALMVTHDPEEALAIAHRVAVLRDGCLEQCASPLELIRRPATAFVGRFVRQANLLPARWQSERLQTPRLQTRRLQTLAGELELLEPAVAPLQAEAADPLQVLLDPERLRFLPDPAGEALVLAREFLGSSWLYRLGCGEQQLRVRLPLSADHATGCRGRLQLHPGSPALLYPGALPLRAC